MGQRVSEHPLYPLPRRTTGWDVTVEDDNGRFVHVFVEALDERGARRHVGYLLDQNSARIVAIQESGA